MVVFTARQNLANLNEVKMNLIVKFANLAGKSYIIGSPAILFQAILLHNVCFIWHLSLHKWCQEKNTCLLAKPQRSSLRIHLCASERAIFGVFNSFTVKKVNFYTINVKFKVMLSSKSGGGGGVIRNICTGHPPTQKSGGGGTNTRNTSPIPPPPPGAECYRIYASGNMVLARAIYSGIPRI